MWALESRCGDQVPTWRFLIKQCLLAREFCECEFCECGECWCWDSPDLPRLARLAETRRDSPRLARLAETCQTCGDLPDSPTFAKPCCTDLPDSLTFARPCCASRQTRKRQVWPMLRKFGEFREFGEFGKFGKFGEFGKSGESGECRLDHYMHIKYVIWA